MLLDPSLFVLFCFAISCIIYGSVRSHSFHSDVGGGENKEVAKEVSSLKIRNVVIFVIVGSLVLILFFYFFNIIYYFLLIIVTLVSFVSLFFVLSTGVDNVFERAGWGAKSFKLSVLPVIHYSIVVLSLLCISFIVLWIVTGYWLVVNCLAWCIGVTQLSLLKLPNLKIAVLLLSAFLLYDVFWVFISPYIFGESVMVAVATKMPVSSLPMTLSMPHILDSNSYSLLGLGDIVLPGLFVCYTYGVDKSIQSIVNNEIIDLPTIPTKIPKVSYFIIALLGYTVGFACTLVSFVVMQKGQPALLYLVPCTLIPISIAAYFQDHIKLMWSGIPSAPTRTQDIEEQALLAMNSKGDAEELDDVAVDHDNVVITPVDSGIIHITVADVAGASTSENGVGTTNT